MSPCWKICAVFSSFFLTFAFWFSLRCGAQPAVNFLRRIIQPDFRRDYIDPIFNDDMHLYGQEMSAPQVELYKQPYGGIGVPKEVVLPQAACQRHCLNVYFPFCASNGITYKNECEYDVARCLNRNLRIITTGEPCKKPPINPNNINTKLQTNQQNIQFYTSQPLQSNQTPTYSLYKNIKNNSGNTDNSYNSVDDTLQIQSLSDDKGGTIPYSTIPTKVPFLPPSLLAAAQPKFNNNNNRCTFSCQRTLNPVCGNDGVTYGSNCLLEKEACINNGADKLRLSHDGVCDNIDESIKDLLPLIDPILHYNASLDGQTVGESLVNKLSYAFGYGPSSASRSYPDLYPSQPFPPNQVYNENNNVPTEEQGTFSTSPASSFSVDSQPNLSGSSSSFSPGSANVFRKPKNELKNSESTSSTSKNASTLSSPKVCNPMCPSSGPTVCGTNNLTYTNLCELLAYACLADEKVAMAHMGKCETIFNATSTSTSSTITKKTKKSLNNISKKHTTMREEFGMGEGYLSKFPISLKPNLRLSNLGNSFSNSFTVGELKEFNDRGSSSHNEKNTEIDDKNDAEKSTEKQNKKVVSIEKEEINDLSTVESKAIVVNDDGADDTNTFAEESNTRENINKKEENYEESKNNDYDEIEEIQKEFSQRLVDNTETDDNYTNLLNDWLALDSSNRSKHQIVPADMFDFQSKFEENKDNEKESVIKKNIHDSDNNINESHDMLEGMNFLTDNYHTNDYQNDYENKEEGDVLDDEYNGEVLLMDDEDKKKREERLSSLSFLMVESRVVPNESLYGSSTSFSSSNHYSSSPTIVPQHLTSETNSSQNLQERNVDSQLSEEASNNSDSNHDDDNDHNDNGDGYQVHHSA